MQRDKTKEAVITSNKQVLVVTSAQIRCNVVFRGLTLAVKTLLLFFKPAWDAAKSTTLPALHLELKNIGKLASLASLDRNTWKYVLSVCEQDQIRSWGNSYLYIKQIIMVTLKKCALLFCSDTCGRPLSPEACILSFISATFAAVAAFFAPFLPLLAGAFFFDSV